MLFLSSLNLTDVCAWIYHKHFKSIMSKANLLVFPTKAHLNLIPLPQISFSVSLLFSICLLSHLSNLSHLSVLPLFYISSPSYLSISTASDFAKWTVISSLDYCLGVLTEVSVHRHSPHTRFLVARVIFI